MEAVAGASTGGAAPAEAVCANAEEVALPDEVDGDAHAPRASPPQHWPAQPRHLLVLDINGLLVDRTMAVLRDAQDAAVEPDLRVGAFHVYDRPGMRPFVHMLLARFVVGVWSSARQHNLRGMVSHIFGAHEERLAFVWGQEACTYSGTSAAHKPLFLKELARLWTEPAFAAFGPHNTLLVDDDAYKAARNPPHTAIHPPKFARQPHEEDTALAETGLLWDYLLQLSTATTVSGWVQQRPFAGGQGGANAREADEGAPAGDAAAAATAVRTDE